MTTPWWANGAWPFVKARLKATSKVFEWGSGGSTECLSKICKVISIENAPTWYKKLSPKLKKNVELYLIEGTELSEEDPSDPLGMVSGSKFFRQVNFEKYVLSIEGRGEFDLVIVDGRARPSCVHFGIEHVKKGGMLLLDDSWRPRYQKAIAEIPKGWKHHKFKDTEHTTSIWVKP